MCISIHTYIYKYTDSIRAATVTFLSHIYIYIHMCVYIYVCVRVYIYTHTYI